MNTLVGVCQAYINMKITIDDLHHWLALYQWDLGGREQDLADEATLALVHFGDGYGTEADVRQRVSQALIECLVGVSWVNIQVDAGTYVRYAPLVSIDTQASPTLIVPMAA